MTFGERLKSLRGEAGLSVQGLADITKIRQKYLQALENEEFDKLPKPVYARAFIKKYAQACNADEEELLLHFKRENRFFNDKENKDKTASVSDKRFVVTEKHIITILVIILLGAAFGYFYINQQELSKKAHIEITKPSEFNTVSKKDEVLIQGKAENVKTIMIKGEKLIPKNNIFEYTYTLDKGLNTITIRAKTVQGKEIKTVRKVLLID